MNEVNDRLVVVATFLEPNQAHVARSRLEAEGIQAALDGEHHIAMNWLISNAIGGVKLLVHQRDLESADHILHEKTPEIRDADTGAETNDTASLEICPYCGSNDVYRERLNRKLVFLSIILLGIPLPFFSRKSVCANCRRRW